MEDVPGAIQLDRSLDVLAFQSWPFNGNQLKVVGAIKINGGPATRPRSADPNELV
jgi:hypothetical protein